MGEDARHGSPAPGGSILITSAPKSDRMVAAAGPAIQLAQSMTFSPVNRLSLMTDSRRLVAEDDRAGRREHAANAMADRDLRARDLRRRNAAHLPHALLQGIHAVHTGMHIRQSATIGVQRQLAARRGIASGNEPGRLAARQEPEVLQPVD